MLLQERTQLVSALGKRFRRDRIEGVVLDLDDFLLGTNGDVFGLQIDRFAWQVVKAEPDVPLPFMQRAVRDASKAIHEEMGVNPRRWPQVVHRLGDTLGRRMRPTLERYTPTLLRMYMIVPRPLPHALATVSILHEVAPVAINSHALGGWTLHKLAGTGLGRYVSHVHVVPVEEKHKNARDWHAAAVGLGSRPKRVITGGDSLIADTIPALEAGVPPHLVCLIQSSWGKHNSHDHNLPDGILTPGSIREWIPALLQEA